MAITQILEKYVQGDDIAITVNIGPDSVGSTCTSKIENYDRVTVATFAPYGCVSYRGSSLACWN
jgi:hypothetical protein